jgi:hypothetical protein
MAVIPQQKNTPSIELEILLHSFVYGVQGTKKMLRFS